MDSKKAKQIPLTDYLGSLGFYPAYIQGINLWDLSPLREEKHPSFKVNSNKNIWYDFGISRGGTIIDFVLIYYNITDVSEALKRIGEKEIKEISFSFHPQSSLPPFEDIKIRPLQNKALIDCLSERGVNPQIATAHTVEIYFKQNGESYFAIGFPNRSGGYKLRNKYFKGCIAPKDISIIQTTGEDKCNVFEGFINYLSYLTIKEENLTPLPFKKGEDYIILNGVLNLSKAIIPLEKYQSITSYLDVDKAGETASNRLRKHYPNLIDGRVLYKGNNDLNDLLCSLKMNPAKGIAKLEKKESKPPLNNNRKPQNRRRIR